MGAERIEPHFLDLSTSWRWVVSFTPQPLYPQGKNCRYPLDKRLRGPPKPFCTMWRRENYWPYLDSNSVLSVVQPVASLYTDRVVDKNIIWEFSELPGMRGRKNWKQLYSKEKDILSHWRVKLITNFKRVQIWDSTWLYFLLTKRLWK
jgi:hypothetical protein